MRGWQQTQRGEIYSQRRWMWRSPRWCTAPRRCACTGEQFRPKLVEAPPNNATRRSHKSCRSSSTALRDNTIAWARFPHGGARPTQWRSTTRFGVRQPRERFWSWSRRRKVAARVLFPPPRAGSTRSDSGGQDPPSSAKPLQPTTRGRRTSDSAGPPTSDWVRSARFWLVVGDPGPPHRGTRARLHRQVHGTHLPEQRVHKEMAKRHWQPDPHVGVLVCEEWRDADEVGHGEGDW
jgi:hypothetical protein